MLEITYNQEKNATEIHFKEELVLTQKGEKNDTDMLNTLQGYILSAETEIPKIIDVLKNEDIVRETAIRNLNTELSDIGEMQTFINQL